jgi:ribonuclease T2
MVARPARVLAALSIAAAIAACREPQQQQKPPRPETSDAPNETAAGAPVSFGLYVLALSWAPNFCCGHASKEECSGLQGSFAANHLTLHGLWPNYSDTEAKGRATYPQFCGAFKHCQKNHDKSCEPDPSTVPAEMKQLAPGYIGDGYFLADHEWPKHGSCTGLDPATYFKAALDAMKARPGESGTPAALKAAVGKEIALPDLQNAFGMPATSVLLSCDSDCRLSQVSFCLAHDAHGMPTTPIVCPTNTTTAEYDNGCVTRGCQSITVQEAGSCDIGDHRKKPTTTTSSSSGGSSGAPASAKCNHPGQGPACTSDGECTRAGFKRCAHSGCCTSVPL